MKKIILLLIMIIFLSGCSIEYNAIISKDNVKENIITKNEYYQTAPVPAYITEEELGDIEDESVVQDNYEFNNDIYYNMQTIDNNKYFTFTFPFNRYVESKALNYCLKSVRIIQDQDKYILNTSGYNNCYDLYPSIEDLKINLTFLPSDFEVISNNADSIKDNVYTWNINRNNYQNKYIQVLFKKIDNEEKEITKEEPKEDTWVSKNKKIIIIGAFVILIIILFIIIKLKFKKL